METILLGEGFWQELAALLLAAVGGAELWHGVRGRPDGEGGLARRRTTLLGRLKGFQHAVSGLMLVGFAAALLFHAPWLVYLALGIGFVELRESNAIIAAMEGRGRFAGLTSRGVEQPRSRGDAAANRQVGLSAST